MMIRAIFLNACPNCGGEIADDRLLHSLPCRRCLPEDKARELLKAYTELTPLAFKLKVRDALKELGSLKDYEDTIKLDLELSELDQLFNKVTGSHLWSAQRTWAKRVLKGRSFAIIAPTGVGKTMFGMLISLYLASKGKRCYMLLPTTVLVRQVFERMRDLASKAEINVKILAYHPALLKNGRADFIEKMRAGDFQVLITTSQFLARNFDKLRNVRFDFIFVDDVDALLKSSRNIDRVLILLGADENLIELGLELIRLRRSIPFLITFARQDKSYKVKLEEAVSNIRKLEREIKESLSKRDLGVLVVSSATGRARGLRVRLFRELLGFEAGSRSELIRNIEDIYHKPKEDIEKEVLRIIRLFGDGGLVFVPIDKGASYAEKLSEFLNQHGVRAEVVVSSKKGDQIERFLRGEVDVLVGVATYYGLLVRGLDLPQRIRYAVFVGVPKLRFSLEAKEVHPFRIASLLFDLRDYLEGKERDEVDKLFVRIMRYLRGLPPNRVAEIRKAIEEGTKLKGTLGKAQELFLLGYHKVCELLAREDVKKKIQESPYILLEEVEGTLRVVVPDTMTYIQASGRTSRMFAGGISKGASIVIIDNDKVFQGLVRKTRWFIEDISWRSLEEVDVRSLINEIDRDRRIISDLLAGKIKVEFKDPVKSALMIVESPSKARTIASFFGRPSLRRIGRYVVYETSTGTYMLSIMASGGHVFDLVLTPEDFYGTRIIDKHFVPVYSTIRRCANCGEQFVGLDACPLCKSTEFTDKAEVVYTLRDLAREVDIILIGTDPDTEGEKIGWDIATVIKPYTSYIRRIEFHEITKRAILEALKNPRDIDERLVEAQIVRRLEDRWIGFALSEELWEQFKSRRLSAGRVQTPVLGWIIQRYNEHRDSIADHIYITLENGLRLMLKDVYVEKPLKEFVKELQGSECVVVDAEIHEATINPPPPFTTDALLREASSRLGMDVARTMSLAQDLFEFGLITYHRTDSTRVSAVGMMIAKEYIRESLGEEYYQGRDWGTGGAHECIRPTRPLDVDKLAQLIRDGIIRTSRPLTWLHYRLYDMIFRRFLASQMKPAKVLRLKTLLKIGDIQKEVTGITKVIYDGFSRVYPIEESLFIPEMKEGDRLRIVEATHAKLPSVMLFSQGDVVDLMKRRGIGRPSTYAKIIRTLIERKYVIESQKRRRLIPTKLGIEVYKYLSTNYKDLVSEERTRKLEKLMDVIELGKADYQEVIKELYREVKDRVKLIREVGKDI